jgi:hypothetical protein
MNAHASLSSQLQAAEIGPDTAPAMRALFEAVFGQPMSAAHWEWKYGEDRGHGIGVWRNGRLIAHYGGITRALLDAGEPCLGAQGADAAVAPGERGHFTRRGPYHLAATTFHARYIGAGKPHRYGFGFPSERHYRLANLLGIYEAVDRIVEFSLAPSARPMVHGGRVMDVAALQRTPGLQPALERAWRRMRHDLLPLIVGVRDPTYLIQRYGRHPLHDYQLLAARPYRFGAPAAFAIVRPVPGQGLEWLDMIGALADLPMLAQVVRRHAHKCGAGRVFGWITASQQRHFGELGAVLLPTEIIVPADRWTPDPAPQSQLGRWWLMSGDTDFH